MRKIKPFAIGGGFCIIEIPKGHEELGRSRVYCINKLEWIDHIQKHIDCRNEIEQTRSADTLIKYFPVYENAIMTTSPERLLYIIDAYIENGVSIIGLLSDEDGTEVATSSVRKLEGNVVTTKSGTQYVLIFEQSE